MEIFCVRFKFPVGKIFDLVTHSFTTSMIAAFPTDDQIHISDHFGRCKYFILADISSGKLEKKQLIENPHNSEEREGVGHGLVLKLLTDNKVNRVFCTNMGERMEDNLRSLHIDVQRCERGTSISDLLR
ncbi:MAG: NifB/NifX family molybdenum-iron cluster-binding protein [Thermoplasmatales archaeon]